VATPREIYSRPATAYAAQFIGHTNLLQAEVRSGMVRCSGLEWATQLPDGPALFSLRPENIRVADAGNVANSGSVSVRGKIRHCAFHGATELLRVDCGNGLTLVVQTSSAQTSSAVIRNEIYLEFSPADAIPVRESPVRN